MQVFHARATARVVALVGAGMVPLALAEPPATPSAPEQSAAEATPDVTQSRPPPGATPPPASAAPVSAPPGADSAAPAAAAATAPEVPAKAPGDETDQIERHLRAEGYVIRMKDGAKLFCKRDVPLGSRLMSAYSCATKEAIQAREVQDQREVADAQQRARTGCLDPCH